ncbi:MAG: hypothetical protein GX096_02385 [Clostridiales bacterium]|nr:hypothetical protein [Clostridiales bacterium]
MIEKQLRRSSYPTRTSSRTPIGLSSAAILSVMIPINNHVKRPSAQAK